MITIKTSQIFGALEAIFNANANEHITERSWPCLIGPSGCGKTQIVGQFALSIDADLVPIHLMSMSPEDAKFPICDQVNETVTFVPANIFRASKKPKLFFWDELSHAPSSLQSLCYQVFEGNRLGDFPLPDDCMHVAAHNRATDKGIHNRVPYPLRRRWYEMNVEPDVNGWCEWAVQSNIDPLIIGFVRWRPEMLYQDAATEGLAADPRAWSKISALLSANPTLAPDLLHALVCGKVGEGAGTEFTAFVRLFRSLPNLDVIAMNPDKEKVPSDPATLYAIAAGLSRKLTVANIGKIVRYLNRMPAEFNVMSMRDALMRDKTLQSTPEVTKWTVALQGVIL